MLEPSNGTSREATIVKIGRNLLVLAALMEWKPGTVAADIGAGGGEYTFAAVERVGAAGKVFATEIDAKKLAKLRAEVAKRKLENAIVLESKEADTNLP